MKKISISLFFLIANLFLWGAPLPQTQKQVERSKYYYDVACPAYEEAIMKLMWYMEQHGFVYNDGGIDMPSHSNQIQAAGFILTSYQNADLNKGRKVLVKGVAQFLKSLNQNKKIKSYLAHYPLSNEDLGVMLFFSKKGELEFVHLDHGNVSYYVKKPPFIEPNLVYQESFEEAQHIINCY